MIFKPEKDQSIMKRICYSLFFWNSNMFFECETDTLKVTSTLFHGFVRKDISARDELLQVAMLNEEFSLIEAISSSKNLTTH